MAQVRRPSQPRQTPEPSQEWPRRTTRPKSESARRTTDRAAGVEGDIDALLGETEAGAQEASKTIERAEEALNSEELAEEELAAATEQRNEDSLYTGGGEGMERESGPRIRAIGRGFTRKRVITGGFVGLLVGGTLGAGVIFLPLLRLDSYLARINQRVWAATSHAMGERMANLFKSYLVTHMLTLERCNAVRSFDCRASYSDRGIASGLFTTWRDVKAEEWLFDKAGIQLESTINADGRGVHRFTIRDRFGRQVRFSGADLNSGRFLGGPRELGQDINKVLRENTKWYEVNQRRSIRKFAERKHGARFWCFWMCRRRDEIEGRYRSWRTRLRYRFIERFVYPFSGKYGLYLDCITAGTPGRGRCSAQSLRERGLDRNIPDEEIRRTIERFDANPDVRLSQLIIEDLVQKIFKRQLSQRALDAIPVIGWIYFALQTVDLLDRADTFVREHGFSQMAADVNANQYLEWYSAMRSFVDEMKTHLLSLDAVRVVMKMFEGAEQSRVFQYQYNHNFTAPADPDYCDGRPIAAGDLVCEEKQVARSYAIEELRGNEFVDGVADALNNYSRCIIPEIAGRCPSGEPKDYVRPVIDAINAGSETITGPLMDGLVAFLRHTPLGGVMQWLQDHGKALIMAVFNKIWPLPIALDSPAKWLYDGLEAGGSVFSSEFGRGGYDGDEPLGAGGRRLTTEEHNAVVQQFMEQQEYDYKRQSFFARLSDLSYPDSPVNQLVDAVPSRPSQIPGRVMANISGFFGNMLDAVLFRNKLALAQRPRRIAEDPFGVQPNGYPTNDPAYATDPAIYTPEYCQQKRAEWEASMQEDPITGFQYNTTTNPCLLEELVKETGTLYFTDD